LLRKRLTRGLRPFDSKYMLLGQVPAYRQTGRCDGQFLYNKKRNKFRENRSAILFTKVGFV
jgi:hypothetical protein